MNVAADLGRAARGLRTRPLFAALVAVTLAVCVGANLAVLSVISALWASPRPFPFPDRLVMITGTTEGSPTEEGFYLSDRGLALLSEVGAFSEVAAQVATSGSNLEFAPRIALDAVGHSSEVLAVTWNYFAAVGVDVKGRSFSAEDDRVGAPPVAIISDRIWQAAFGRSPHIIGTEVLASPFPVRIVGILPPKFHGARLGERVDIWVPRHLLSRVSVSGKLKTVKPDEYPLLAFARLRRGLSLADASRMMDSPDFASRLPLSRLRLIPASQVFGFSGARTVVIGRRDLMWLALGTAGLILSAGVATLMSLVAIHLDQRRRELAIRLALGASRVQAVRVLSLEFTILAVAGLFVAFAVKDILLKVAPLITLPGGIALNRLDFSSDWRLVALGGAISVLTVALSAYRPLRTVTRAGIVGDLLSSSANATTSSTRVRKTMVGVQAAVSVVVLVLAARFITTVSARYESVNFSLDRTLFAEVRLTSPRETTRERLARLVDVSALGFALDKLKVLPGVEMTSIGAAPIPSSPATFVRSWPLVTESRAIAVPAFAFMETSPPYFDIVGVPITSGRKLTDTDAIGDATLRPVLVTRSLAARLWPTTSPLGRSFQVAQGRTSYQVVGVVEDFAPITFGAFGAASGRRLVERGQLSLAVRTSGSHDARESIHQALIQLFPTAVGIQVATARELLIKALGQEVLGVWLFSAFGLIAFALATGGVVGLIAYLAESRRREVSIRLCLGAHPIAVMRLILATGLLPVALGIIIGAAAAVGAGALLDSIMVGVSKASVEMLSAVCIALFGSALMGGVIAALRVRRVPLCGVLRGE